MKKPGTMKVLWRGLRTRCGRCGGRPKFRAVVKLEDYCPSCGYQFAREEGFFTGVYMMNFGFTIVVLLLVAIGYLFETAIQGPGQSVKPYLIGGLVLCVVLPIVGYRVASMTWAALDLLMRPLEPVEVAEADLRVAAWAQEVERLRGATPVRGGAGRGRRAPGAAPDGAPPSAPDGGDPAS